MTLYTGPGAYDLPKVGKSVQMHGTVFRSTRINFSAFHNVF